MENMIDKKLMLCIETGTDVCSAALAINGKLIALRESDEGHDHARNIAMFVDEMLRENDLTAEDLDAVAIGRGPGSYTGLRIGTAFAKGLCYGLGIPLVAVDSLESLARIAVEDHQLGIIESECWESTLLCPMIDARRMEVFCAIYDTSMKRVSEVEAKVINSESFAEERGACGELLLFGSGAAKCDEVLSGKGVRVVSVTASARGLCSVAYEKLMEGATEDIAYFEPFYLKDFVVTRSKKDLLNVGRTPKREE